VVPPYKTLILSDPRKKISTGLVNFSIPEI
jgi:hypothetical protein